MAKEQEVHEVETEPDPAGDDGTENRIDWKALSRKWEGRAKENAEKACAYDKAQGELEEARRRADEAQGELAELRARAERDALRERVSGDTGVPARLLRGETEEELRESARALIEWARPAAPRPPVSSRFDAGQGEQDAARRDLARQMFGR